MLAVKLMTIEKETLIMTTKDDYVYRCPKACPIKKRCFVLKVREQIKEPIEVIQKCKAEKKDILIYIGGERPP